MLSLSMFYASMFLINSSVPNIGHSKSNLFSELLLPLAKWCGSNFLNPYGYDISNELGLMYLHVYEFPRFLFLPPVAISSCQKSAFVVEYGGGLPSARAPCSSQEGVPCAPNALSADRFGDRLKSATAAAAAIRREHEDAAWLREAAQIVTRFLEDQREREGMQLRTMQNKRSAWDPSLVPAVDSVMTPRQMRKESGEYKLMR